MLCRQVSPASAAIGGNRPGNRVAAGQCRDCVEAGRVGYVCLLEEENGRSVADHISRGGEHVQNERVVPERIDYLRGSRRGGSDRGRRKRYGGGSFHTLDAAKVMILGKELEAIELALAPKRRGPVLDAFIG